MDIIDLQDGHATPKFWVLVNYNRTIIVIKAGRGGANGEKWRKMAKNGDGEFGFFICQIRHFSPIFDFGISHLTDF